MTEEERRIISAFVERMAGVSASQPAASPWGGSSVPATQSRPPLPPVDPEADRLIGDLFARYPEARYRLTQTAFVQEHALVQAQNRIQELEWQLENTQRQAAATQQQSRGGLFGGMFGGGGNNRPVPMTPRPQPVQPPQGMNPAMMQQGRGSGFLGSALTTAAGVAGGMMLGNMLMGAFSGGGAAEAATTGAGEFGQDAVPASSPWTDPAAQDAAPAGDSFGNDAYASNDGYADDAGGFDDGGFDDEI